MRDLLIAGGGSHRLAPFVAGKATSAFFAQAEMFDTDYWLAICEPAHGSTI
ncbi:hypothetical protein OIU92_28775 [Escherichia coli]|nr:hypothetical protein [Escherichia coli]